MTRRTPSDYSDLRWLPNTRVRRTRSSPSAHRSPLTRYPLGGLVFIAALRAMPVGAVPEELVTLSGTVMTPANNVVAEATLEVVGPVERSEPALIRRATTD